jgi:hypothetical protein
VDESKVPKAHFDYQEIIASIIINKHLYDLLTNGVLYPAIWDTIKATLSKVVRRKEDLKELGKKNKVCLTLEIEKGETLKLLLEGNVKKRGYEFGNEQSPGIF